MALLMEEVQRSYAAGDSYETVALAVPDGATVVRATLADLWNTTGLVVVTIDGSSDGVTWASEDRGAHHDPFPVTATIRCPVMERDDVTPAKEAWVQTRFREPVKAVRMRVDVLEGALLASARIEAV